MGAYIRPLVATTATGFLLASGAVALASGGSAAAGVDFASGKVLVQFARGVSAGDAQALEHANAASVVGQIPALGVNVLRVRNGREQAVVESLRRSGKVAYAETDGIARVTDVTPNDYWWPAEWAETKVHAPSAWSTTTGSSAVTVAVLDTGLTQSSDLSGNILAGYNIVAGSTDTTDDNGHGTMAASVVGARSNNSIGVASYCWQCSLMPVKVMDSTGNGTYSDIANGITWATDHGANVISMSLSGTTDSATLHNAVQYAHSHGVVLAAAAGNSSCNCASYPAAYAEVLGVAATDSTDALASYSNYGSWVKVAAPGTHYAVTQTGTYGQYAGTSSATPAVAGVAALLRSAAPAATNTDIETALENSATSVGSFVKYGRIDAAAALAALGSGSTSPTPTASPTPTTSPSATTTTTSFSGSLSSKSPSKSYPQTLPVGSVRATLTFTKASSLTVALNAPDGSTVATATGASPVQLTATTSTAGTYTWVVSGAARTSFTLNVSVTS